jgi:hypothetical protein
LSVELAGGGIAVETRVVLGGGASQEDAKDLHQKKVGILSQSLVFVCGFDGSTYQDFHVDASIRQMLQTK